jgi:hypothetical protein
VAGQPAAEEGETLEEKQWRGWRQCNPLLPQPQVGSGRWQMSGVGGGDLPVKERRCRQRKARGGEAGQRRA